ncbi:MAG: hypothetical protein O2951_07840 [Bacteroidetes bacterium]|nr:hypothetical protein [Bacteroidota bacterium]
MPVDFSEYSGNAIEQAVEISSNMKEPIKVIVQNVYQCPQDIIIQEKRLKNLVL